MLEQLILIKILKGRSI